ncbi:MAG: hypothetical protein ACPGID_03385 [Rubricella sp.]
MDAHLPREVLDGIARARKKGTPGRLAVHVDGEVYRVVSLSETELVLAEDAPHIRGLVHLYDGPRHLADCLIYRAGNAEQGNRYEFKRRTDVSGGQPVDFEKNGEGPAGLLEGA